MVSTRSLIAAASLAVVLAGCAGDRHAPVDAPPGGDITFRDSAPAPDLTSDGSGDSGGDADAGAPSAALPGSGPVRGYASAALPDGSLLCALWRGDAGYTRSVPLGGGLPQWQSAGSWTPRWQLSDLPGSGAVQTLELTLMAGNTELSQGAWRSDEGYSRSIPVALDSTVDWANASSWGGPLALTSLPGAGSIAAQTAFVDGTTLHQSFWRGSERYARRVPIDAKGVVQWDKAESWTMSAVGALPGSGAVDAEDVVRLPDGTLVQTLWRGGLRYRRSGALDSAAAASLDASTASAWDGPIAP